MSTKLKSKRMTAEEKKAKREAERAEMQADALEDIDLISLPLAVRLFGPEVDPVTVIDVSSRMFDDDGEVDEEGLEDSIAAARKLADKFFGGAGADPRIVIAVLDRALERQEADNDNLDGFITDVERAKVLAAEKFGEHGRDPMVTLSMYDRAVYFPADDE